MNSLDETDLIRGKKFLMATAISAIVVLIFYWLTCFRTFTWWDSSEYSLAALALGIPHPPGSFLTVIAGWIVTRIPIGIGKFFALNLLSALMALVTTYLVGRAAAGLYYRTNKNENPQIASSHFSTAIAISLAILFFGLSATMWHYAIRFTPYVTTSLLTALIIMAMLAWQARSNSPKSYIWLALVTFLFGLDFSIHRTNLLMLPGLFIWMAIFKPDVFISIKHWIFGIAGLAIGLSIQLLLIPIAAGHPFINFNDPSTFGKFWDYITLKQYGGGWLINMFPRKAPFFDVQVADYISVFRDNFVIGTWPVLRFLPSVLGLAGAISLFKQNKRISLGLIVLFLFSSLGAVVYFNLPENFFRSIDRHYMPSFVIFAVFIAYGAARMIKAMADYRGNYRIMALTLGLAFLTLMPIQAVLQNYKKVDGSKSYFAYDTAKNFLAYLPQNTILFTQADIDTYTLWCLQLEENFRKDVTVCNLSLMNTPWFIKQVLERDRDFPLKMTDDELMALSVVPWHDSTFSLSVIGAPADYGLPSETILPASISYTLSPTLSGQYILAQDQVLMRIITDNSWRRPIYFSALIPEAGIEWLMPYLRLEGLYWRMVPARFEETERNLLRKNLFENLNYRGYADPSIPKENPTKWMGWNICGAFLRLSATEYGKGDTLACHNTMDKLTALVSPDNLGLPPNLQDAIENSCR